MAEHWIEEGKQATQWTRLTDPQVRGDLSWAVALRL